MEDQYLDIARKVLRVGKDRETRNGNVRSIFFSVMTFDLSDGTIPLLTTKFVPKKMIWEELQWFLSGSTDAKKLDKKGVKIWNDNSTREFLDNRGLSNLNEGDIGAMYGHQLRHNGEEYKGCDHEYNGFDQIKYVEDLLKNPNTRNDRRIMTTTYSPHQLKDMCLAPCHGLITQFYVREDKYLDCFTYQRSCDLFLGCPFNIASYAMLVHILAKTAGLEPGVLRYTLGDIHIYENAIKSMEIQVKREPLGFPKMKIINKKDHIWDYTYEDFEITDYKYYKESEQEEKLERVKMMI